MPRRLPRYVRRKTAKGKVYLYFDTGQKDDSGKLILSRLPNLADPTFGSALGRASALRTQRGTVPHVLTLTALINLYEKSPKFTKLAPSSRALYSLYLKKARELLGIAPAGEVEPHDLRIVLDGLAETPSAANAMLRALGAVYKWGRGQNHVSNEPTKGVEEFEEGEHQAWPESLVEEALKDEILGLPVGMLYYTAQRIGDVCKLRWSDIRSGGLQLVQQKTGLALTIPIHRDLKTLLDTAPKTDFGILQRPDGKPWEPNSLRKAIKAWAKGYGQDVVPHGLRKNAVNALLEAGCSTAETAAISGQTLQMIEHYAKGRNRTTLGKAAILRWEGRNKA